MPNIVPYVRKFLTPAEEFIANFVKRHPDEILAGEASTIRSAAKPAGEAIEEGIVHEIPKSEPIAQPNWSELAPETPIVNESIGAIVAEVPKVPNLQEITSNPQKMATLKKIGLVGLGTAALAGISGSTPTKSDELIGGPLKPAPVEPKKEVPKQQDVPPLAKNRAVASKPKEQPVDPNAFQPAPETKLEENINTPLTPFNLDVGTFNGLGSVESMRNALTAAQQGTFTNQLGKAAELIGSSIARAKPVAQEAFNQNIKVAQQLPEQHKQLVDSQKDDPNSPMSQAFKKYMGQFGVNVSGDFTASMGEKIMPWAYKSFEAEQNRKATAIKSEEDRKSREMISKENRLSREALTREGNLNRAMQMKISADQKKEDKQNDFISKENHRLVTSKEYQNLNKINNSVSAIDNALKNPNAVNDISALYDYVKGLDPDSAVREGEVALGKEALGLWGRIKVKLQNAGPNPRIIDNDMLKDVQSYLRLRQSNAEKQYRTIADSKLKQAKSQGIDESRYEEVDPIYSQSKVQPQKTIVRKAHDRKNNRTQYIYSDGTKEIVDGLR